MGRFLLISLFIFPLISYSATTRTLSYNEALKIGLQENLNIKIAELDAQLGQTFIDSALSTFDINLTSTIDWEKDKSKPTSNLVGSEITTRNYSLGADKTFWTGTELEMDFINTHTKTNNSNSSLVEYWGPVASISVTQPLVKNSFGYRDRRDFKRAIVKDEIYSTQSKDKVENELVAISNAYWELSAAQSLIAIQQKAVKQAQKLYTANQRKIKLGTIEKTDLLASLANVELRQKDVLEGENELRQAQLALRSNLQSPPDVLYSAKDALSFKNVELSLQATLKRALSQRKDYLQSKEELKHKNISLQMERNALLPTIDLVASLAANGINRNYTDAFREVRNTSNPTYYLGMNFSFPLGNHSAKSSHETSHIEKLNALYTLKKLENDIHLEIEKKIASFNIIKKQVKATTAVKKLQQQKMIAEEKKFSRGRSSINVVIQYQEEYLQSSSEHTKTLLKYQQALIDIRRSEGSLLENHLKERL